LLSLFLASAAAQKLFTEGNKANKDCVPFQKTASLSSFLSVTLWAQIENAESDESPFRMK